MWQLDYSSRKELDGLMDLAGLAASRRFGQNFLLPAATRQRIVDAIGAGEGELVWEIGPGLGALTSLLLSSGATVKAFEIDHGFCALLEEQAFTDEPGFSLVEGDALKTLFEEEDRPAYICGNLPYNVGSPCIAKLIENDIIPRRMVFTLQKEVVERMCARPSDESYSSFSVVTQLDYSNKLLFNIHRTAFHPQPNVDSAVVVMEKRIQPMIDPALRAVFLPMVRDIFAQRRKTVRNNLVTAYAGRIGRSGVEEVLSKAGLGGDERAEVLDWTRLEALASSLSSVLG